MDIIKARLREPSTWAGLGVLALQAGKLIAPQWSGAFDVVAMLLGGGAVVAPERGQK